MTWNLPYWFVKNNWWYHLQDMDKPMSERVKIRLAMIECYYALRDVSAVCRMFKSSRKHFYKWKRRYEESGKLVSSLEDHSRAPHRRRRTTLDPVIELEIKHLREQHLALGKVKLQIIYEGKHGRTVSQNHIQQVIHKYQLYPLVRKAQLKNKLKKGILKRAKVRVNRVKLSEVTTGEKPLVFCLDSVVLYLPYGVKRYVLTAIEHSKKIAFARVYPTHASKYAKDFLLRLQVLLDAQIFGVVTDNGSEFEGEFAKAVEALGLSRYYTRLKTPKDNAIDERFNRTIQEEFMDLSEEFEPYLTESDLTEANRLITDWLIFYNFERPHQTLGQMTPIAYYNIWVEKQNKAGYKLSPMCPTRTRA